MNHTNPILNSPYCEPEFYYDTDSHGRLDYDSICSGRRIFKDDLAVIPARQSGQKELFAWNEDIGLYSTHLINLIRNEVGKWRAAKYPNTTRITRDLLIFWFDNPERNVSQKLFFAQQEAVETAIWLNEVAEKSNAGQNILNKLRQGQQAVSEDSYDQLPRIAFKMATGTGKTVVMACLICYHYFNRQTYRNDTRYADYFLIVAPGITIKDRLGVLFVDTQHKNPYEIVDYYRIRGLVPQNLHGQLEQLNARLVISNYHAFEPKTLQGNKKSPFDGKVDLQGNKIDTGNKEDFTQVIKRNLGKFKKDSRLLILNDEAHHCYLPKSKSRTSDNEEVDENVRAAVWFSGLKELSRRFKLQVVYDLSATPYYLSGSGYPPYSLFPWVVSDFGLIEAIESGLVKIPFLPESDNTQDLSMPVLRDLYRKVMEQDPNALPRKGQKKQKSEASAKGSKIKELPPRLPSLVKGAIDQFYSHYKEYDEGVRQHQEARMDLFSPPPVFIAVCNNTSVSKEVYKYLAGYEYEDENGETRTVPGAKDLFSNYDPHTFKPLRKPPTLIIDSDALDDAGQINEEFKKIFASEIQEFKRDYARLKGQGSVEKITDAEILREVVNTVGRQGKLGAHIRCVVSVSMLTEGWDANTVTHIMGLRAFGSQLLCEQVAGRALRRMNYTLKTYRKDTGEEVSEKEKHRFKPENLIEKFPPEYAHIIGVPFTMFKGGKSEAPPAPVDLVHVSALSNREEKYEITFPNVSGYRVAPLEKELICDFSKVENYEIVCSQFPLSTTLSSAFSDLEEKIEVSEVFEKREQEICFSLTKSLINLRYSDQQRNPEFQYFHQLLQIVRYWYNHKIQLIGESDPKYRKLVYFDDAKRVVDHIARGINPHLNTQEHIRPIFNYYNPFSSTKYVYGNTVKPVFETQKSHVNVVVMDSEWEGIAAKALEEIEEVKAYVKNQFLGFGIPYVKEGRERTYFPDLLLRCQTAGGKTIDLILEISGMSQDKAEKKWYLENRWLPAVNALRAQYEYNEWHFLEVANDIRDIKNQLIDKLQAI